MNTNGGGATAVMPPYQPQEDAWGGSGMISSTGSLANSRHQTSQIAKTYRQAANLYLTRRLPEALSTIEGIILPPGHENGNGDSNGHRALAPVATASRGTRIKVWSFYLTFLNAVIELGPEEGKHAFGSVRWKQLVNKARDGTVWEEIVREGYSGNEGAVDADVVINLATILLTHSPSQKLNQQRLETYFSAISQPSFDISAHLSHSQRFARRPSGASGTNTPRDLNSQIKLLELYTLHVLPRNGEWDYAREFIMMSEVLDDERKEAFLQALHGLKEDQENAAQREKELQRRQREELEEQRRQQEEQRIAEAKRAEDEARRREEARNRPPDSQQAGGGASSTRPRPSTPNSPTGRPDASRPSRAIPSSKKNQVSRQRNTPPPTMYRRATALVANLQSLILNMGQSMRSNPMALMRMILFLLMFALAFGRRDIRERVKRVLGKGWDSVAKTVGMGTKVSYI